MFRVSRLLLCGAWLIFSGMVISIAVAAASEPKCPEVAPKFQSPHVTEEQIRGLLADLIASGVVRCREPLMRFNARRKPYLRYGSSHNQGIRRIRRSREGRSSGRGPLLASRAMGTSPEMNQRLHHGWLNSSDMTRGSWSTCAAHHKAHYGRSTEGAPARCRKSISNRFRSRTIPVVPRILSLLSH